MNAPMMELQAKPVLDCSPSNLRGHRPQLQLIPLWGRSLTAHPLTL